MVASMPVDVFIAGYEQQIPRKKKWTIPIEQIQSV
jgi:hypothetical protein